MQTNAAGGVLHIGGGIAVRSQLFSGHWSDADPVPLEAIRGAAALPDPWRDHVSVDIDTQEPIGEFRQPPNWQMVTLTGETLRERVMKSVIPVSLTVSVPAHGNSGVSGPVEEIVLAPDDPLVNKFPGDWLPRAPGTIQRHLQTARIRQVLSPHIANPDIVVQRPEF